MAILFIIPIRRRTGIPPRIAPAREPTVCRKPRTGRMARRRAPLPTIPTRAHRRAQRRCQRRTGARALRRPTTHTPARQLRRIKARTATVHAGSSAAVGKNGESAYSQHYSTAQGTVGSVQTSAGGKAVGASGAYGNTATAGKAANGNMYATSDGNVYKNTGSGWQKANSGGGWSSVNSSSAQEKSSASSYEQQHPSSTSSSYQHPSSTGASSYQQDAQNRERGEQSSQRYSQQRSSGGWGGRSSSGGGRRR